MTVLSLFDGMSCGQIALVELGVNIDKYYASEVDIHAIKQTQLNFPNTIQLGDVTKWQNWDIKWSSIDLILAGSPCQGFSFAGKQLAFDDPRSKLFFEFALILNNCKKHNPNVRFLLENVDMKREYMRIISEYVGIFPTNINSNLVSAQNRSRLYWTNIKINVRGLFDELYTDIPQPIDRGILLKDILDDEVDEKYYVKTESLNYYINAKFKQDRPNEIRSKSDCLQSSIVDLYKIDKTGAIKPDQKKASCFTAGGHSGGNHSDMDLICVAQRGRGENNEQQFEPNKTGKTNCITSVAKDNLVMQLNMSKESSGKQPYQQNRIYDENGIMPAVMTENRGNVLTQSRVRRLTPIEVSRLQTIPDWYVWKCSDTQIYRMCGNGWTIEVIKHILSFMK